MNSAISQAARILRDKRTGIVDEQAYRILKDAEEYLWQENANQPFAEPVQIRTFEKGFSKVIRKHWITNDELAQ